MSEEKRYYWLKLQMDFFKKNEVKIIEGMPNGKDYVIFYLKLLIESANHKGYLRLNETVPYDNNMLSIMTDTNIDIVRCAVAIFEKFKMLEILDDGTIYMNEIENMIGSETKDAERKRIQRQKEREVLQKQHEQDVPAIETDNSVHNKDSLGHRQDNVADNSGQCPDNVTKSIEYRDKDNRYKNNKKTYMSCFEDVWANYPRKQEKSKAYKCYQARLKDGYSPEEMLQATKEYAAYCKRTRTEEQYIKLGSTFFGPNTPFIDYIKAGANHGDNSITEQTADSNSRGQDSVDPCDLVAIVGRMQQGQQQW